MPKTKFQDFVFTIVMVFVMVYFMSLFNTAYALGGLTNDMFLSTLIEMPITYLFVLAIELLLVGRVASKIAFKLVNPAQTQPILITVVVSSVIVMITCPCVSLFSVFLHGYAGPSTIITSWFTFLVRNFPMALFLQIFFAGPVVRAIFRPWFSKTK